MLRAGTVGDVYGSFSKNIVTHPTSYGLDIYWDAVGGDLEVDRYAILVFARDTIGAITNEFGVLALLPVSTDSNVDISSRLK
jgi:hypothetical protein